MKRKVAVVLAAIMALSPISAFAATENRLTKQPNNFTGGTLMMEEGWTSRGMLNLKDAMINKRTNPNLGEPERKDATTDDIKYVVDGTTLELKPINNSFKAGETFKIVLDNSEWFFRSNYESYEKIEATELETLFKNIAIPFGPESLSYATSKNVLLFKEYFVISSAAITQSEAKKIVDKYNVFSDKVIKKLQERYASIESKLSQKNYTILELEEILLDNTVNTDKVLTDYKDITDKTKTPTMVKAISDAATNSIFLALGETATTEQKDKIYGALNTLAGIKQDTPVLTAKAEAIKVLEAFVSAGLLSQSELEMAKPLINSRPDANAVKDIVKKGADAAVESKIRTANPSATPASLDTLIKEAKKELNNAILASENNDKTPKEIYNIIYFNSVPKVNEVVDKYKEDTKQENTKLLVKDLSDATTDSIFVSAGTTPNSEQKTAVSNGLASLTKITPKQSSTPAEMTSAKKDAEDVLKSFESAKIITSDELVKAKALVNSVNSNTQDLYDLITKGADAAVVKKLTGENATKEQIETAQADLKKAIKAAELDGEGKNPAEVLKELGLVKSAPAPVIAPMAFATPFATATLSQVMGVVILNSSNAISVDKATDSKFNPSRADDIEMINAIADYVGNYPNYIGRAQSNGNSTMATYDVTKGKYYPNTKKYINTVGDISYELIVSESNSSVATVKILSVNNGLANAGYTLRIPLVTRSIKDGDIRVKVAAESNTSIVTSENVLYGQAASAKTKTTVKTKIDSKYTFYLDQLIIAENVPNSLQQGQMILTAPYGFTWADPGKKTKIYNEDTETYDANRYVEIIGDETLKFTDDETSLTNETSDPSDDNSYIYYYNPSVDNNNRKIEKDKLIIDTKEMGLIPTGKTTGKLVIKGLCLLAEDYAPLNEEIKVEIRDRDGDIGKDTSAINIKGSGWAANSRVTKENVVIGNRKDWGVKFDRISDITTLVSGRYEDINNSTEFDKEHKVAKVKFSENVVASWWALRESEFTLTEGVKFRKVKIDDETNLDHTNTRFTELEGDYLPSKDRQNYVFLDATKLRIVDLEIERDKTASFTMQTWVSIEPGFEGDIEIKAGGNDILKETTPIVVAKAVAPITITSKVKDVKIGYQWQKVEDITLTETAAGRLKRDTELRLFIDDDITGSDSIAIAPDFVTEVNDTSNIKISKPAVDGGEVTINIERASYKTAATIKLSNVYVKIDRTVPESNKRPYKIVAGGTAIAANYVGNADRATGIKENSSIQSTEPFFNTKGIGVDYLNVVTSAPDKDSILSNIVTVKNGSNELKVGNDTVTMDTEAYISAETNSMMVPVRFVAVALGIADDQVKWDEEARTVTIYNGARVIQFTLGKSEIIVNGVKSTIYSPDVPPIKVNVEVKDQRSFLPFRALGTALGVEVDYDATTQAAIYNYSLLKDGAKAATEAATETPAAPATTTPAAK